MRSGKRSKPANKPKPDARSLFRQIKTGKKKKRGVKRHRAGRRTLLVTFCSLLFLAAYLIDYGVSDETEYRAAVLAAPGGFVLSYPMQTVTAPRGVYKAGSAVCVTAEGVLTAKGSGYRMTVDSVEQTADADILRLSFAVRGVPTFLTTREYMRLAQSPDARTNGTIVRSVTVRGKQVFGKFIVRSLSFED